MIWHVPSTVTDVEASHEAYFLVDDDHFLVMTPELRDGNVGMSVDFDVFVHAFEMLLDVLRVVVDQKRGFHETDYKHFDTSLGNGWEYKIESIFTALDITGPFEHEIRCDHPSSDAYLSFSLHQFIIKIFVVPTTIIVEFGITEVSLLSITVEPVFTH